MTKARRRPGTTVEKRQGGWSFRLSWRDERGQRHYVRRQGFATEREARAALTALQAQVDSGHALGTSHDTVESFLRRWLESYEASGSVKPSTVIATRLNVERYIIPRLGNLPLRKLNGARIAAFYVELRREGRTGGHHTTHKGKGLSAKTVKNIGGTLHKALSDGVRLGVLTRNPSDGVDLPRWERPELRVWTMDQVATFLRHVENNDPYTVAWWRLSLLAGLRRGELAGLRWANVDLVEGVVNIVETRIKAGTEHFTETPKTRAGRRVVSIDPDTVTALARLKDTQETVAGGVLPTYVVTDPDGTRIVPQTLTKRFRRYAVAAGLPPIRLHDGRHTHVSQLIESDVALTTIAARVGHSRPSFTLDTYGHLLPNADRQAVDAVSRALADAMNKTRRTPEGHRKDTEHDISARTRHAHDTTKPKSVNENTNTTDRDNGADDGNRT